MTDTTSPAKLYRDNSSSYSSEGRDTWQLEYSLCQILIFRNVHKNLQFIGNNKTDVLHFQRSRIYDEGTCIYKGEVSKTRVRKNQKMKEEDQEKKR